MLFISYANEYSRLDENLHLRSQYYSDHREHFLRIDIARPLAFCVCSLFFYDIKSKRISNRHSCDVYIRSECGSCPADVMVLGVSYSRVLAQRPKGYCSASTSNIFITQHKHIAKINNSAKSKKITTMTTTWLIIIKVT